MLWFVAQAALASDVDLFDQSSSFATGQGTLQGESPLLGEPGFSGGLAANYAKDPVVRLLDDGTTEPAVDTLIPFTLSGGWTFGDRARASILLPIYPWVSAPINDFAAGTIGDVVAQVSVPLWTSADGATSVGLVPRVGLPTGSAAAAVSRGTSAELVAAVAGTVGDVGLVWNASLLGAQNQPLDDNGVGVGSSLGTLAGAFWQATDGLRVGGELDFDYGLAKGPEGRNHTGAAHAFVQSILPTGVGLSAGVGTGTLRGLGSPAFRVFGAFTYTAVDRDPDRDQILGKADVCPTDAEDRDGFEDADGCPDGDNDGDGIGDGSDLCPDEPEDVDGWDDLDGCLEDDNDFDNLVDSSDSCPDEKGSIAAKGCPDRDEDGIVDASDTCPDLFGTLAFDGCPDRDGDKIPEPRDQCPDAPVPPGTDLATSDGCPPSVPQPTASVYRKGSEIKIMERIEFELGKAELRPVSFKILNEVAALLVDNPDVKKIEVQGHTDNVGSDPSNLKLSASRAEAVATYLAGKGVARERMVSKGYGETAPLFSNKTAQGRDQNRRVQFMVLEASTGDTLIKVAPVVPSAVVPSPVVPSPVVPSPVVPPIKVPSIVVPPAVTAPAPVVPPPPAPVVLGPPGTLDIVLPKDVWGTVALDGEMLSKAAPFQGYSVSAGEHTIRVQNSRLALDWSKTFTVVSGKTVELAPLGEGAAPAPAAEDDENPWAPPADDLENPWATPAPAPAPAAPAPAAPAPAPAPAPKPKPSRKDLKR